MLFAHDKGLFFSSQAVLLSKNYIYIYIGCYEKNTNISTNNSNVKV